MALYIWRMRGLSELSSTLTELKPFEYYRFGVFINKKDLLLIKRFSHKDSQLELLFSEHVKDKSQRICLEEYQEVEKLKLPSNVRDLPNSEKTGFSNERTRDISSTYITAFSCPSEGCEVGDSCVHDYDVRLDKYNCLASVNLSSSMQTNVPYPFNAKVKFTHLNMPGGQLMREAKYTSEQLHSFHPVNNSTKIGVVYYKMEKSKTSMPATDANSNALSHSPKRFFSTEVKKTEEKADETDKLEEKSNKLSKRERLKAAFKEYGATIVVLHITLSLASFGICYVLISSGVDLETIVKNWGWSEGASTAGTVGPVVVAYAVHKVMAPMRISLSLLIAPFLVQYLRKKGFRVKSK